MNKNIEPVDAIAKIIQFAISSFLVFQASITRLNILSKRRDDISCVLCEMTRSGFRWRVESNEMPIPWKKGASFFRYGTYRRARTFTAHALTKCLNKREADPAPN